MIRNVIRCGLAMLMWIGMLQGISSVEAQTFSTEGPITDIDPANGIITVNYVFKVKIQPTLTFTGARGRPSAVRSTITGANLASLLDDAAPGRVRSIYPSPPGSALGYSGATLIATGAPFTDATGTFYYASSADLLLAENLIVGNLQSVDPVTGVAVAAGQPFMMNPDERFTSNLFDAGGKPISMQQLAGDIGDLITVSGYMVDGKMYATEVLTNMAVAGTVRISKADGVGTTKSLTVLGVVGTLVPLMTVSVYDGVTNKLLGTVPVTAGPQAGGGSFAFKPKAGSFTVPTKVKVVTSNGLTDTATVIIK